MAQTTSVSDSDGLNVTSALLSFVRSADSISTVGAVVSTVHSWVASVKDFEPGMSAGYGRTWQADRPTRVAAIPIGYGDGLRRGLSNKGEVLIGGNRYPIAGTISMDNITVDVGPDSGVKVGDEVTLIGTQNGETILSERVAEPLGTINYEVTCGISPRVPRVSRDG